MVSWLAANSNNRLIASRTSAVPLDRDLAISSEMSAACLVSPIVSPNAASAFATVVAFSAAWAASVAMLASRVCLIIDVVRDQFDRLREFGDGGAGTGNLLDGVPRRFLDFPDLLADFLSCLRRLHCERFHFGGDDGESLAGLASSRRFDRCIQRSRFVCAATWEIRPTTEPTFSAASESDLIVSLV